MASNLRSSFATAALGLFAFWFASSALAADPPKYYFELKAITPKPELNSAVVALVVPRVSAEIKKAFEQHAQIVAKLDGAPDPKLDPDAYRGFIGKLRIADAYNVTVEITDAVEALVPVEEKPGAQRLEIKLALRMLGSHIPDDTLGFTGHGKAKVEQEFGSKVPERERQDTWSQVTELAVSKAIETALEELSLAAKTKPKQKPRPKPNGKAAHAAPH